MCALLYNFSNHLFERVKTAVGGESIGFINVLSRFLIADTSITNISD